MLHPRLPQCGQIQHHQHAEAEEGVQGGAHPRRNQSVAVCHADEARVSH